MNTDEMRACLLRVGEIDRTIDRYSCERVQASWAGRPLPYVSLDGLNLERARLMHIIDSYLIRGRNIRTRF